MRSDLWAILPEIVLVIFASVLFLARLGRGWSGIVSAIAIVLAAKGVSMQWGEPQSFFADAYATGSTAAYLKAVALCAAALSLVLLHSDRQVDDRQYAEILALMLLTIVGGMLLISARHMAVAYLGFEMLSVPSYALVGSITSNSKSTEGGLKYAVFGGAASGFLLYGFSLLYGMSGSLYYGDVYQHIGQASLSHGSVMLIAIVFVFVGAMYKLAAAPFHYWAPDAFEGGPVSIAGFLSIAPKVAGFGLLMILTLLFSGSPTWRSLIAVAAVLSMTFGNLAAIAQQNVKRLLAYSSIAHAGYILVAASTGTRFGLWALLFYLTVYLFMNLGAFYIAGLIAPEGKDATVDDFKGLSRRTPFTAFCMAIFLFSLTGLPPFGGFIGKMLIISAALHSHAYFLIAALVTNSVISLYYYARILRAMYFDAPQGGDSALEIGPLAEITLTFAAAMIVVMGLWWGPIGKIAFIASGS